VTEKRRGEIPRLGWKYFDRDKDPLLGQNLQQPQKRIRFSGARLTLLGRIRVWDLTYNYIVLIYLCAQYRRAHSNSLFKSFLDFPAVTTRRIQYELMGWNRGANLSLQFAARYIFGMLFQLHTNIHPTRYPHSGPKINYVESDFSLPPLIRLFYKRLKEKTLLFWSPYTSDCWSVEYRDAEQFKSKG
jgi:hypothetical protein